MKAYYDRRAPEYDDWYEGTGAVRRAATGPAWHEMVDAPRRCAAGTAAGADARRRVRHGLRDALAAGRVTGIDQSARMLADRGASGCPRRASSSATPRAPVRRRLVRARRDDALLRPPGGGRARALPGRGAAGRAGARRGRLRAPRDVEPEEWQERVLNDGSRWTVYKRYFTPDGLLGGARRRRTISRRAGGSSPWSRRDDAPLGGGRARDRNRTRGRFRARRRGVAGHATSGRLGRGAARRAPAPAHPPLVRGNRTLSHSRRALGGRRVRRRARVDRPRRAGRGAARPTSLRSSARSRSPRRTCGSEPTPARSCTTSRPGCSRTRRRSARTVTSSASASPASGWRCASPGDAAALVVPLARLAPARQRRLPVVRRGRLPARLVAGVRRADRASARTCSGRRRASSRARSGARGAVAPGRRFAAGWSSTRRRSTRPSTARRSRAAIRGGPRRGAATARRRRASRSSALSGASWELRLLRPELVVPVGGLAIRRLLGRTDLASRRRRALRARRRGSDPAAPSVRRERLAQRSREPRAARARARARAGDSRSTVTRAANPGSV